MQAISPHTRSSACFAPWKMALVSTRRPTPRFVRGVEMYMCGVMPAQIKSYLVRNPSMHLAPLSLPFFLVNGNYALSGFDASSTVYEVSQQVMLQ